MTLILPCYVNIRKKKERQEKRRERNGYRGRHPYHRVATECNNITTIHFETWGGLFSDQQVNQHLSTREHDFCFALAQHFCAALMLGEYAAQNRHALYSLQISSCMFLSDIYSVYYHYSGVLCNQVLSWNQITESLWTSKCHFFWCWTQLKGSFCHSLL